MRFKRVILLKVGLLMQVGSLNAQGFSGIGVSPNYITEMDDVIILDTVDLSSPDFRLNDWINDTNDTLFLHLCYRRAGGAQGGKTLNEKTNIGKLPSGNYVLKLTGTMTSDTTCFSGMPFFNELTKAFTVHAFPSNVKEVNTLPLLKLKSNLVSSYITIDNKLMQQVVLNIYDLTGRLHHSFTVQSSEFNLDVSDWNSGIYIVAIQIGQERKRWKVFKE